MQQVRQARNRVAHPVGGRYPVGNGPAIGVEGLVQFPAQARELGTGEQAPIAGLFAGQQAHEPLQAVSLGVAIDTARVHAQVLGNGGRCVSVVEHQQHRDRHVSGLAPASALRLPQQHPL